MLVPTVHLANFQRSPAPLLYPGGAYSQCSRCDHQGKCRLHSAAKRRGGRLPVRHTFLVVRGFLVEGTVLVACLF
jgi:hypothetical protein